MKCIGGKYDGTQIEVAEHYKVGDLIKVPEKHEFKISSTDFEDSLEDFRNNRTPRDLTLNYYLYRIAVFHFNKDEYYKFLVPNEWTDKQAILYQFGK